MKKLIPLLSLSLCCFAAFAQPTSFGGITPGKTTREELKGLVTEPNKVGASSDPPVLTLKQPERVPITVTFRNDVVYIVTSTLSVQGYDSADVDADMSRQGSQLKQALIDKYGSPTVGMGKGIREIRCQNGYGATSRGLSGSEGLAWPDKDGVRAAIYRVVSRECPPRGSEAYFLIDVAIANAMADEERAQANKADEEARRKLGNAY